jgi:hypothetical protein
MIITTLLLPLGHIPFTASSCPKTSAKRPATARNGHGPRGPRRAHLARLQPQLQRPRLPSESNPTATSIDAAPRPPPSPGTGHRDLRCSCSLPSPRYPHPAGKLPQGQRRSRSCCCRLFAGFARRSPPATAGEEAVGWWW